VVGSWKRFISHKERFDIKTLLKQPGQKLIVLVMGEALRFLVCLLISCSVAFAARPPQAPVPQSEKPSCCAKAKGEAANNGCDRPAPKSNEDKQCCSLCAFCVAILATMTPFVYAPTGEQFFAAFLNHEQIRAHRPPVPPPRA
jgi:hypothetical protein